MNKKIIIFTIHTLTVGGSEKVIVNLINNLNREKYIIHLCVFHKEGELVKQIRPDIQIHDLQSPSVKKGIFKLVKKILKIKPNIVFSGISHLNLLLSLFIPILKKLLPITFIARETSIVSIQSLDEKHSSILKFLYKNFYKNFDIIICQSKFMLLDLIKIYKIPESKLRLINNPVDILKIQLDSKQPIKCFNKEKKNIVIVAGLRKVKGHNYLLHAIPILDEKFVLHIIGSGDELQELESIVSSLKIKDKVVFHGFQKNPYKYIIEADLVLLTSLYEGFPNVVLEANACGIPVVAFNCPGGISEIIIDGINGFLVEEKNIVKLAETINKAISYNFNSNDIKALVQKNFSNPIIIQQYEDILK